ncbi:restriction endonuclease subunit S [Enterococcus faecium]|uniref:restriction endonuclease subunit S n=3 Tax=Enterococcus faecium TaxID=1352 RepID=UPI00391A70A5
MSNDTQPEIRFPEFTDEWEQRKLGEVATRVTRKNKKLESTLPLTISAQFGLVDQNTFFNKQIASKDVSGYYLLKKGEFAYNKSYSNGYPWGAVKRLDKYDMGVLSTLYICFRPVDINSDFLASYYDTDRWYKEVSKHAAEGARNHGLLNIAASDFFETELMIPKNNNEQEKIADFFKSLDTTITLHQRKLDLLKETKKGFLQKMFPKNGAKVPEIRFPGFTEDWEARKLIDYLDVSTQKNKDEIYDKGDVLSVSGDCGIVNQIEFQGRSFAGVSVANYGVVETGDIVYTKSPLKANPYGIIKTNKGKTGIVSTLYAVYKPKQITDPEFVQIYFEQDVRMNNYMRPLVNKGAKNDMKVSDENALKGEVMFPKLEEQRKISSYFEQLNNLITLHQRELDLLKETKKGFLQKMFV